MTEVYQPKYIDGTLNPKYKKRTNRYQSRHKSRAGIFIAWDGEGAMINGKHEYILLRNSAGDSVKNPNGLSTLQCLTFICESARDYDPRAIHVMFGMSYDVNMMLRDLDRKQIQELHTTGRVQYLDFIVEYIQRKEFTVRRIPRLKKRWKQTDKGWKRVYLQSVKFWDTFGFFQSSFVSAIKGYLLDFDPDVLSDIQQHKLARSTFHPSELEDIERYCNLEVLALRDIMLNVWEAMKDADIMVKRWDGAGAVAAALLDKESVKVHQAETPAHISKEAWRAYAGGRIELVQYGRHCGPVWHGDINSAYPTVTRNLPSLADGEWISTVDFMPGVFGLWRIEWDFSSYRAKNPHGFYPFFYRNPVDATIRYPVRGAGTYWNPEVEAALKHMPDGVRVIRGWVWIPKTTCQPFAFIDTLYQKRKQYKADGKAAQKIIKLGLNSLYGKLAQRIGYRKLKPAYQQVEWAGYITSSTRSKLFDVAMQNPLSIIMFCTDGIFTTHPLKVADGVNLGEWDVQTHDEIIVVQSGVYWTRTGDKWSDYYRGFDRGSLTREAILSAWEQMQREIDVSVTRFITFGRALAGDESWKKWRTWDEGIRTLKIDPYGSKRMDAREKWTSHTTPAHRLQQTVARNSPWADAGELSAQYKGKLDDDFEELKWRMAEWDSQL